MTRRAVRCGAGTHSGHADQLGEARAEGSLGAKWNFENPASSAIRSRSSGSAKRTSIRSPAKSRRPGFRTSCFNGPVIPRFHRGARAWVRTPGLAHAACTTVAAALVAGTMVAAATPAAAVTQTSSFSTTPLDVVGGPVAAEGAAVVITADASHNLHVEGVAPNTGRVIWSHPYSMSAIIPGLAPTLYVVDNDIVDLVPVDRPNNALVDVEGVNATTGTVVWQGPQHILVSDVPAPCEQKRYFCLLGYSGNASTGLAILNPVTGTTVTAVQGPAAAVDLGLYLTDAQTPTLEALSATGTVVWTKTIDQLFGGPGYNPLNGWDFLAFGGTEIGTAGATNADHSNGLDDAKTVGVSLATGATLWSLPGQFQCGGTIAFMTPPLDCVFTGTVAVPRQKAFPQSYKGLHLSLQGYDAATGHVTWTQPVRNVGALGNGDASFLDTTHLLVQLPVGRDALLDTASGKTVAVSAAANALVLDQRPVQGGRGEDPQPRRAAGGGNPVRALYRRREPGHDDPREHPVQRRCHRRRRLPVAVRAWPLPPRGRGGPGHRLTAPGRVQPRNSSATQAGSRAARPRLSTLPCTVTATPRASPPTDSRYAT